MRASTFLILLGCLAIENFARAQQTSDSLDPELTRDTRNINTLNSQRLHDQRSPNNPGYQHEQGRTSTRFQSNRGTTNQFGYSPRQQGSSQWAGTGQQSSSQVTSLGASENRYTPITVPAPQNQNFNQLVGSEQRLAPIIQPAPLLQGTNQVGINSITTGTTGFQGGQITGGTLTAAQLQQQQQQLLLQQQQQLQQQQLQQQQLGISGGVTTTGGGSSQQLTTSQGLGVGIAGGGVGIAGGGGAQFSASQGSAGFGVQGLGASGGLGYGVGSTLYIVENIMDGPYWDGSYYYRYETSDGSYREEGGVPNGKCRGAMLSIRGSFSHVTPRGVVVHHEYMSDKNGYSAFPAGSRPDVFSPPERQPIPPELPEGGIQACTPEDFENSQ